MNKNNALRFLTLVFIAVTAPWATYGKNACRPLFEEVSAKQAFNTSDLLKILERYDNNLSNQSVPEIPGAMVLHSMTQKNLKLCSDCKQYVNSVVNYLFENTSSLQGFNLASKRISMNDLLIEVLIDSKGQPLGSYIYLISDFKEIGNPANTQKYWVNAYFDGNGVYIGRGEGMDPTLTWSFY